MEALIYYQGHHINSLILDILPKVGDTVRLKPDKSTDSAAFALVRIIEWDFFHPAPLVLIYCVKPT